ncbi:MAG: flagellar hook-basal body complex protein FliE [Xanthobacteraceae bacterium]
MPSPIAAANAYASLARIAGAGNPSAATNLTGSGAAGQGFGALVENALSSLAEKGKEADAQAMQLAAGKADLVDVVTAVAETEVAVETLVSVRDKVIQAYEEIFRMPI